MIPRWLRCLFGYHHTGVLCGRVTVIHVDGDSMGIERQMIVCKDCGTTGIRHEMYTTYEEASDPVFKDNDDQWYFYGCDIIPTIKGAVHGPYATEMLARTNLKIHAALINGEAIEDANNS